MSDHLSDYQREQIETLRPVRPIIAELPVSQRRRLAEWIEPYRSFRAETDLFLSSHFSDICSRNCYQSRLSACCSKEGIITFFADVVINVLASDEPSLDRIEARLSRPNTGHKCVYLDGDGCLWTIKPIVCQMFLCEKAEKTVFSDNLAAAEVWEALKCRRKTFTWPDRPVLFDDIETVFIEAGHVSPLMYLHHSPGLIRVKQKAGLVVS